MTALVNGDDAPTSPRTMWAPSWPSTALHGAGTRRQPNASAAVRTAGASVTGPAGRRRGRDEGSSGA
jgi:hypothetical protein